MSDRKEKATNGAMTHLRARIGSRIPRERVPAYLARITTILVSDPNAVADHRRA